MLQELKDKGINSLLLKVEKDDETLNEIPVFTNNLDKLKSMINFENDSEADLFIPTIINIIYNNTNLYFKKFNLEIKRLLFEFIDNKHENKPNIMFNFIYDTYSPDADKNMFVLGALSCFFDDETDSFKASSIISLIEENCKFRLNDIIIEDIKKLEEEFHNILNSNYENENLKKVAVANFLSDLILDEKIKEEKISKYNDEDYESNCYLFEDEFQYYSDNDINMYCAEIASYDETQDSIFNDFFIQKLQFPSVDEIKEAVNDFKEKTEYEM